MSRTTRLVFTCPADFLETAVNKAYPGENYFVSSPGNTLVLDRTQTELLEMMLDEKPITDVLWVLADNNPILHDVLGAQTFDHLPGLGGLKQVLAKAEAAADRHWYHDFKLQSLLTVHLDERIRELRRLLHPKYSNRLRFEARIYARERQVFRANTIEAIPLEIPLN